METPVRIAFVITELDVGGAERCLTNLVVGLDRAKFDPIVIALKARPVASQLTLVSELEAADVPIHFMGLRSPLSMPLALMRLRKLLQNHRTDVVQSFLYHANVLGTVAAKWARVEHVLCGIRVADPSRFRMKIERLAIRQAHHVVCVSQSVADFMAKQVSVPREKLIVIPNGYEAKQLEESSCETLTSVGFPLDRRVLLAVGRLHEQKGFDWLLGLAPKLFDQLPDHDVVILGEGPERKSLQRLVKDLNIDDRVHLLGWQPGVARFMQASEQFLLSSRWEGMPNALIEAMGHGLPVVATSVEGVDEVLGPLVDQQTAEFGDDQRFTDNVVRIANDEHEREQLGSSNRDRIRQQFSMQRMIDTYQQLYSK